MWIKVIYRINMKFYYWSGWSNYSDLSYMIKKKFFLFFNNLKKKVKSYNIHESGHESINESAMGNRGTKSHSVKNCVKAQRVDGSWVPLFKFKKGTLRCTLMDFERSYQVRILSNQSNNLFFSTWISEEAHNPQLNPFFVTGFCDAESSFQVLIIKSKNSEVGWRVRPLFSIGLHSKDLKLLLQIKYFFDCGIIVKNKKLN